MTRGAEDVALGPQKDEAAQSVAFRCPPTEHAWLKSFVGGRTKLSETVAWAVRMGREYYEAIKDSNDRIEAIAASEGIAKPKLVGRLISQGLAAYEKERRSRR